MKILIEPGVKEYLNRADTDRLVIGMIPDRTNACCGVGETRKFYTPDVRPAKPDEQFGNGFRKFQSDGLDVWVSNKALDGLKDDIVTISLKKSLFSEELECKGIEPVIE